MRKRGTLISPAPCRSAGHELTVSRIYPALKKLNYADHGVLLDLDQSVKDQSHVVINLQIKSNSRRGLLKLLRGTITLISSI